MPALIEERGLTVEQAGRVARYRFYEELAQELGANKVAVGQTRDDQAETVLLHLIRGVPDWRALPVFGLGDRQRTAGLFVLCWKLREGKQRLIAHSLA